MKKYGYTAWPEQTIIREMDSGFTYEELLGELQNNGEGIIIADSEKEENLPCIGKDCRELKTI